MANPVIFGVGIDLQKSELRSPRIHNLAAAPGSPVEGQLYYDTVTHALYVFNGTVFVPTGMTFGAVQSETAFGTAADNGDATDAARANHKHGNPAHGAAAHAAISLSDLLAPTADLSVGTHKLTSVTDPTAAQDAATKAYVDAQVAGARDVKDSVRLATNAALAAYTRAGNVITANANGAMANVDGVAPAVNDRILLKNGAAGADNGIYTVTQLGDGTHPFILTRAADADSSAEVTAGMYVWVSEGTVNADTGWLLTTDDPIVLNTTALTFTQVSALGQVTAGAGLTKTGSTLDVGAGTGIVANADDVAVLRTDANGRVPLRFAQTIGDGAATSFNIDHNLNSLDVVVQIVQVSDGRTIIADTSRTTVNRVVVAFDVAPANNAYRVVVLG